MMGLEHFVKGALVRVFIALAALFVAPFTGVARAQESEVVVELVPDPPGPYSGGESVTVDVWLHSQVSFDAFLNVVQLDFSESAPALSMDATVIFDLSAIPMPRDDYATSPELPVPVVWVFHDGPIFPENMLPLPAGGSLHIGSIGVQLPTDPGTYRLDAMNVDDPSEVRGARILTMFSPDGGDWRAFTGEITGGNFAFVVNDPPIPTVSQWGLIVMVLMIVAGGTMVLRQRRPVAA